MTTRRSRRKRRALSKRRSLQALDLNYSWTSSSVTQASNNHRSVTNDRAAMQLPIQAKFRNGPISAPGDSTDKRGRSQLPGGLRARLETLSGEDLSAVNVHRNSGKPAQINAAAYTQGQNIYLGSGEESQLPHEAWHAVQQRQGKVNPDSQARGLPLNSDAGLEREADQMGAKAAATGPLTRPTSMPAMESGHALSNTIQRYVKYAASEQKKGTTLGWKHPDANYLKVAEDGEIAIGGYKQAWATDARRKDAETVLKSNYSRVKLEQGSKTIRGKKPSTGIGGDITLTEVKAVGRDESGRSKLTADCGTAAREILGLNRASDKFSALVKPSGTPVLTTPETYHGGHYTTPDFFADKIFQMHFGSHLSASAARALYQALPASDPLVFDKDDFDKKYKINKYATPELGQAITANQPSGWNFHFAGVLLKSIVDYITGENYPGKGRDEDSWYFGIYGPKSKAQTFHDKWSSAGGDTTTMVIDVRPEDRPLFMLKKAIKNSNSKFVLRALKNAVALKVSLKLIIDRVDTGFMKLLEATDDKHINAVLKILKKHYLPSLTLKEKTALVLKGAKGYTYQREMALIKAIMEVSSAEEYTRTISAVEKEVSSESDDIIVESLIDSSGKLSLSKVPKNLKARQAIVLVKSLVSGVCVGDDEAAVLLILKSLSATEFRKAVNSLGLDYIDSGLDGAEWERFLALAASRYSAGANIPAARIASENNDDAARMLVYRAGIKARLSHSEWLGIIRALLSGSCGDDDELAIIRIVRWFEQDGQLGLINSSIGEDDMDSGVDGAEWTILAHIMKRGGYNWSG